MKGAMLMWASLFLTFGAFALLQAASATQPFVSWRRRRAWTAPPALRALALAECAGACLLAAGTLALGEAILFVTASLVLAGTIIVLVAPLWPRVVWGTALVGPSLSTLLVLWGKAQP